MTKRTHILQVIPSLAAGGISSVVMNWLRNLDRDTYQFDFIVFNDGPLRADIEQLGGKIYVLPTMRQAPWRYYQQVTAIVNGDTSYDAIHVHNSFKNVAMLWLAKHANIPLRICHSHTSGLENKRLSVVFEFIRKLTIKCSNVHLACGKNAGQFLYQQHPFTVINNAIDVANFRCSSNDIRAIKQHFDLPTNKQLIVHVGRFSEVKNHQFIVELAKQPSLNTNIHFVCIGEGPLKPSIAKQIIEEKLHNTITLLPATNKIPELLTCMHGFIMPSLFEGVSVALLEAQATGLPCFISDTIAPECDMQLGLVKFLDLQQPQQWLNTINNTHPKPLDNEVVHQAFDKQGYSIKAVMQQLYQYYQRNPGS